MADQADPDFRSAAHEARHPATYRSLFAVGEFRALFLAYLLSVVGDQLAKVALAVLVFQRTNSAGLAAVTFAVGYLPWLIGGPLLSVYADRLPRRVVLVACDASRCALIAVLVIPGLPLWVLVGVLFLASLPTPPFEAARSALLPDVLDGERYALGISVSNMTSQLAQVAGFAGGGALVTVLTARGALAIDACTFALSGALILYGVRRRPAATAGPRRSLWADSGEGLRLIARDRRLRLLIPVLWVTFAFTFAQEGLAAPFSRFLGGGAPTTGILLAANPLGMFLGGMLLGRLCPPVLRERLMLPLAGLAVAALVPVAVVPGLPAVLACYVASGLGASFMIPLNIALVRAVPAGLRGRVFGVANTGLQAVQGLAIVAAGAAAEVLAPDLVVTGTGVLGLAALALVLLSERAATRSAAALAGPLPAGPPPELPRDAGGAQHQV